MMAGKKVVARDAKPRLSASPHTAWPDARAARDSASHDAPAGRARAGGAKGAVGKECAGRAGNHAARRSALGPRQPNACAATAAGVSRALPRRSSRSAARPPRARGRTGCLRGGDDGAPQPALNGEQRGRPERPPLDKGGRYRRGRCR